MPENRDKKQLVWTEEHDAFCYEHHIRPAAKILWRWLMRQKQIAGKIEPDLLEFNAWVAKTRGKPYGHNYVKKMFETLVSCRVLQLIKRFAWNTSRILLRPLSWLNPPKKPREKNLQNHNSSYKTDPSNDTNAEQGINSSSNSPTLNTIDFVEMERRHDILSACAEYQIYFHPKKQTTRHLLEFDIESVKKALGHFVKRGGHQVINNPQGWLINCLRNHYWEEEAFGLSEFLQALASWFPSKLPRDY